MTYIELNPNESSRILSTNPICFLTTGATSDTQNVMVLSWLTCINNSGLFNHNLIKEKVFNLNVAGKVFFN